MPQATGVVPLNLDHFEEPFFREAIRRHVEEYAAYFDKRLVSIYVSGSVHRNEAVSGISDLDLHPFITDTISETDRGWWRSACAKLDREFGRIHGLGLPRPVTEEFLTGVQAASLARYTIAADMADGTFRWEPDADERKAKLAREYGLLLRYDATLVWGRDLIEGRPIPPPERTWAQVWFLSPWELTRYAAGVARENRTDFDLPDEPRLRLHELAKLVKLGGAALLMARGEFRSFRYADIFPSLASVLPQWSPFLEESSAIYFPATNPSPGQPSDYLTGLLAWMDWIGAQLFSDAAAPAPR